MAVSFGIMLGFLQQAIALIKDPRLASKATRYSIKDTVLAAFSVFFLQCESFLEHQRQMQSLCGQDNAQSLFGLNQIMPQNSKINPSHCWEMTSIVISRWLNIAWHLG